MKTQHVSDITIDRIVETEIPFCDLEFLVPGAPEDLIERHADWLMPRFIDPASSQVVMSFHSLLLRTERCTILVDSCIGNDKHRPLRPNWHRQDKPWLSELARHGVAPEDIDIVMCTHLHADHVGWNTRLQDGRWVPTFPNAQYVFGRDEYDYWERQYRRDDLEEPLNHGSFEDSVLPVVKAGRATMVSSDHELENGIWLEPAPGHTPGNVVVNVSRGGENAVLLGDVIHTPAQLAVPHLNSRFCEEPERSRETRLAILNRVAETDTTVLTAHFPTPTAGRVVGHGEAYRFDF